jgi:hypothetical protein
MSHHPVTSKDIPPNGEHLDPAKVEKARTVLGGVAVLLGLASMYLLFVAPDNIAGSYAYSWLFAFFFFFTLTVGGCFWVLLHNVSNSGWGTSVRRVMENLGSLFPWMALFALPLLCPKVQAYLYEWMAAHRTVAENLSEGETLKQGLLHSNHLLYAKYWWLNLPFWYGRFVFYFVGLGFVIWWLRKLSTDQDTDPNPGTWRLLKARRHSTWPLIILGLTITFAGFDWLAGLDYTWFSTMWGVYLFTGSVLSSMAVIILSVNWLRSMGYLGKVVTGEHYHIMGKLLFAFTVFWAYIAFSQYFLIWYADITEETRWFLVRNTEGWNTGAYVLLFGHFVVPFLLLLPQRLKRQSLYIGLVAGYILLMHAIDIYIIVLPERGISLTQGAGYIIPRAYWGDLFAFVTVGAGFLWFYLRAFAQHALYPNRDPRILESANVSN